MQIKTLFNELETFSIQQSVDDIFEESGMRNRYQELDFGFFPLGSGILNCENYEIDKAIINDRCTMVLGNDFGTIEYVNNLTNKCETNSPTIRNLKNIGLDLKNTFFTNFYLGLRDNIEHPETTMIHRQVPIKENYKKLCSKFFQKQMELVNPSMVICLGQEVKKALVDSDWASSFTDWKPKSSSIAKIYSGNNHLIILKNEELNINCTFIIIPHPCDIRNFNSQYQKILKQVTDKQLSLKYF